jgi:phosphoglycerate dehydrogenase-like enzyme
VHTPGANTSAVVEFVLAVLLDAIRPRLFIDRAMTPAQWESLREDLTAPRQVEGLTLGVLGLGRVGSCVARIAGALGATVLFNDLLDIPETARAGAQPVPLEALLQRADALTVHVDGRPANRGLIGERALALVRPDMLMINTSRGLVVDEPALAAFLLAHPDSRAILDVHAQEPIGLDSPLLGLPNVYLTPHIGAATRPAHLAMSWVVRDVWRVLCGQAPERPAPPA